MSKDSLWRRYKVREMLLFGRPVSEIAEVVGLSPGTIRNRKADHKKHIRYIITELGARDIDAGCAYFRRYMGWDRDLKRQ